MILWELKKRQKRVEEKLVSNLWEEVLAITQMYIGFPFC